MQHDDTDRAERAGAAVARRTLLGVAGAAALLATAGCNPFSTTRTTRTVTQTAPEPIDPMETLIAMTRLHLLRLQAGEELGGATAKKLAPLAADRSDHLTRLLAEQARVNRTKPSAAGTAGQSVPAPKTPAAAAQSAADDAAAAQLAFSDQLGNVSKFRAAMFASIAACLATHRVVLT
ncbi:hypothetical protein [Nakamurella lactea]|uniref:hypothetical protein n=1 Tax=Nakamurella lactea TaxID=459515 RepID=UPI00040B6EFB|nr:hypothetical protein [Nakamurella lactea]